MSEKRVLVVDDEATLRFSLCRLFSHMGLLADAASCGIEGIARAASNGYDLIILDSNLPDCDGIQVLGEITRKHPEVPVIMLTGCASIQTALDAVRLGAYDCVAKPLQLDEIQMIAERALEQRRLIEENNHFRQLLKDQAVTKPLRDMERYHIERVLTHTKWNQSRAAIILDIDRKTLRNKIREFKLQKSQEL